MDSSGNVSMLYILLATFAGGCLSVFQKPFLRKYNAIEATTYVIWGGTLFLLVYTPQLFQDFSRADFTTTLVVIYLGVFPGAVGYLAWSYTLSLIPASRAVSFLYFIPFIATFMGWLFLGEVPAVFSLLGGVFAIARCLGRESFLSIAEVVKGSDLFFPVR